MQHGLFNPGDDFQMVLGPTEVEGVGIVGLAEPLEIEPAGLPPLDVLDVGDGADVASRLRNRRRPLAGLLFEILIVPGRLLFGRRMALLHQPGDVAQQIHPLAVADAKARPHAVSVHLPLAGYLTQGRGVQ